MRAPVPGDRTQPVTRLILCCRELPCWSSIGPCWPSEEPLLFIPEAGRAVPPSGGCVCELQVADIILDSLAGVIRGHSWGRCPCRLERSVWASQQQQSGTIQSKCWGLGSFGEGNTHPCSLEKRQAVMEAGPPMSQNTIHETGS